MNKANSISRRDFLRAAACAAAATRLAQSFSSSFAAEKVKPWVTAIRDGHLKITGEPTCWAALKRVGATGMEVLVNDDLVCTNLYDAPKSHRIATKDDRDALHAELTARGATITAFCMNNRLDERLELEVDWARRLAHAAEQLNVRAVRIDVVAHKLPADEFLPFAIKSCRQLCDAIKDTPVRLGIENHGRFTNDPKFLESLFDGVGSDQLGLTLDAMNFYWFGHPLEEVYGLCQKFAARVVHTHCKNLAYPAEKRNVRRPMGWEYEQHAAPLDAGDLEYRRIAGILREANYAGDLCLENECLGRFPKEEHVPILKREVAALRGLA